MKKGTVTIERYTAPKTSRAARISQIATGVVASGLVLASQAFAVDADISAMAKNATDGTDAVKTAVVALVGVVLTIGLLIWGSRHLKPKG